MTKSSRFPVIKQLAQMTFLAVSWNCVLIPSVLFLLVFFNISVSTGNLPSCWKIANMVPVYKKGNRVISKTIAQLHLHQLLSKCWRVLFLTIFAIISWLMVLCTQTNMVSPQGNHVLQPSVKLSANGTKSLIVALPLHRVLTYYRCILHSQARSSQLRCCDGISSRLHRKVKVHVYSKRSIAIAV